MDKNLEIPGEYKNYSSYISRWELHRILPSPDIKWTDYYYQSLLLCANEIVKDKNFMLKIKRKEKILSN